MVEQRMDVSWLRKQLEEESPDLLREMVQGVAEALMGAEADALCGAAYGERSPERVNFRNGYREREWDTRVGTIELAIPKLRQGSYFPDWLLVPGAARSRHWCRWSPTPTWPACRRGGWRSWCQLGIERMSKSQVSRLAGSLDEIVEDFRTRPLDGGPYPYLTLDALVVKCREGGRIVNAALCTRWPSAPMATASRSGWTSSPARTAPPGRPSCAAWSPAASPACSWSPATRTPASSTRSPRPCPAPAGSGAGRISCATC